MATTLEMLGIQQLIEKTLTIRRQMRAMPVFRSGDDSGLLRGLFRLRHLRFLKGEPMLTGILHVAELPPQSTFWLFLASLHLGIARQLARPRKVRAGVGLHSTDEDLSPGPRCGRRPTSSRTPSR